LGWGGVKKGKLQKKKKNFWGGGGVGAT